MEILQTKVLKQTMLMHPWESRLNFAFAYYLMMVRSSTKICEKTNIINYLFNIELIIDEENQYVIRSS